MLTSTGPRLSAQRGGESARQHRGHILGGLDQPGGLGDGPGNGHDVGFLELDWRTARWPLSSLRLTCPVMNTAGVESKKQAADGGEQVGRARAAGGQGDARHAGHARARLGGEARGLLVAHADDLRASQAAAGVEQVRDHPA